MTLFRYRTDLYVPGKIFLGATISLSLLMWWLGFSSPHMTMATVMQGMIPFSLVFVGVFGLLPFLATYWAFPEIYISDDGIGTRRFGKFDHPIRWADITEVQKTTYLDKLPSKDRVMFIVKSSKTAIRIDERLMNIGRLKDEIVARRSEFGFKLMESDKAGFRRWSIESL